MSVMSTLDIIKTIPHRYPILLVDRVVELEHGKSILAYKNVTANEPFFQGHFPDNPVMPGVLMVEAMAQALAILAFRSMEVEGRPHTKDAVFYFAGIDGARFKRPVLPGDRLYLSVEIVRQKGQIWKANGKAMVDDELACQAELLASYKG